MIRMFGATEMMVSSQNGLLFHRSSSPSTHKAAALMLNRRRCGRHRLRRSKAATRWRSRLGGAGRGAGPEHRLVGMTASPHSHTALTTQSRQPNTAPDTGHPATLDALLTPTLRGHTEVTRGHASVSEPQPLPVVASTPEHYNTDHNTEHHTHSNTAASSSHIIADITSSSPSHNNTQTDGHIDTAATAAITATDMEDGGERKLYCDSLKTILDRLATIEFKLSSIDALRDSIATSEDSLDVKSDGLDAVSQDTEDLKQQLRETRYELTSIRVKLVTMNRDPADVLYT